MPGLPTEGRKETEKQESRENRGKNLSHTKGREKRDKKDKTIEETGVTTHFMPLISKPLCQQPF